MLSVRKMKKGYIFVMGCMLAFGACTNAPEETKLGHDELIDSIETMDSLYAFEITATPEKANEIIALYTQFVTDFPEDSLAPIYMMKMAETQIAVGEFESGIANLDSIITLYPGFEDVAACHFLKGWAYEQNQEYDKAREAYKELVTLYPDHVLAKDARKMIPLVGLSPSEQLKKVMKEN